MDLYHEALTHFQSLLERARQSGLTEPTAFTLSTADAQGRPAARTLLLKEVDARGFVFYTNTRSRKGQHLAANPFAALCFFWQPIMEQVLVQGRVEPVSAEEADAYWATRPRLSQLGAWASEQSQPLVRREDLEARLAEVDVKFAGTEVPRPDHWSGYRVVPDFIEFWSARPGRLHERTRYQQTEGGWIRQLINP